MKSRFLQARKSAPFLFLLLLIAAVLWRLTSLTPLLMDDYDYSFSWATGERLAGFSDILASQAAHWRLWGGRSVAHFLAQLFLYLGKPVFDALNPIAYLALLLSVLYLGGKKRRWQDLALAHFALFLLLPGFGTVFLWLDGACNYLWCTALALSPLLLTAAIDDGRFPESAAAWVISVPVCFLAGWTNENTACGVFAGRLLWLFFRRRRGGRIPKPEIAGLIAEAAGILMLLLAPGNFARAAASAGVSERMRQAAVTFLYVAAYAAPLGLAALIGLPADTRTRERFLALAAAGVFSGLAMLASPEFSPRTLTGMAVLLLAALFSAVLDGRCAFRERWAEAAAFALAAALAVVSGLDACREVEGCADAWRQETGKIEEAASAGLESVAARDVPARGRYTTEIILSEDPEDWPNRTLAKYYGVRILKE